jgi:hypothetical protein
MAINWRQRATVFQLLAAVYAELGEEAVGDPSHYKMISAEITSV